MSSAILDFILGREHKNPIVKAPEQDPFTDKSLHKIERLDEYFAAMNKANRCPICGNYCTRVDNYYGSCPRCDTAYYNTMRCNANKLKALGVSMRDIQHGEYGKFMVAAKWLENKEITADEAKAYTAALLQSVRETHRANLEMDQRAAATSPAQKLSHLIQK